MLYLKTNKKSEPVFENKEFRVTLSDNLIQVFRAKNSKAYISIDLKSKLRDQIKLTRNNDFSTCKELIFNSSDYKLIVNNVSGNYFSKKDSIVIENFEANLLLK